MIRDPFGKSITRSKGWQTDANQYDRRIRVQPRPKPVPGASGRPDRDPREGTTIAQQRAQDKAIKDWVQTLDDESRAQAVLAGVTCPLADPFPRGPSRDRDSEDPVDHSPSALCHTGSHNGNALHHGENPILDSLEPRAAVAIEDLSEFEIIETHTIFAHALHWVHGHDLLVKKARRMATLIALCRPDLATGLPYCPLLSRDLLATVDDLSTSRVSLVFGRVFAWAREVATLSALGIRASIIAYVIRPELLDAATNQQIGAEINNTRAAINKLVQEFRDTFAGIRAPAMRGEGTRAKCRAAQLA